MACSTCAVTVSAASAAVLLLTDETVQYGCIFIAASVRFLLTVVDNMELADILLMIDDIFSGERPQINEMFAVEILMASLFDITPKLLESIMLVFIENDIKNALLEGTLYGTVSDNLHTIIHKGVSLVEYNLANGVRVNWMSDLIHILETRNEIYTGPSYLRLLRNFSRNQ